MYDTNAAEFVCSFISLLKHSGGKAAGKPFDLLQWQKDVLQPFYGTLREDGLRQYQYLYLEIPKKNGKQLCINAIIPTPNGFATMGDIRVGDMVFDERGKPCRVVAKSDVDYSEQAYRITFKDGAVVDAGAHHQWMGEYTWGKPRARVMTTEELYGLPREGNSMRFRIPVAEAIETDTATLPVSPYLFGYWLGNGHHCKPEITIMTCDVDEVLARVKQHHEVQSVWDNVGDSKIARVPDLKKILVQSFHDKDIPIAYLRASREQRLLLLQGLMDSDGCISDRGGQAIYTSTEQALAHSVSELLWSLGIKNAISTDKSSQRTDWTKPSAECGRVETGETLYLVKFTAYNDVRIAGLNRKQANAVPRNPRTRSHYRYIDSIEPIENTGMQCIQVDSPSRLYLVGRSFLPTHNSELAAALGLYHAFADGEMGGEVYVCAADRENASIVFNASLSMLEGCPALKKRAQIIPSQKIIRDKVTNTIYKVMSSEAYSKHGYKPSCVIFDELHAQPNRELWDIMTFGAGAARAQPVWIVLTTAGDDPDRKSIGWEIHEKARKILAARKGEDPDAVDNPIWLPVIYGCPDDADIYDEDNWYKANPSLGHTIDIATVRQEAYDARESESVERLFRWLRLNQWIALKTVGWLPLTLFDNTVDGPSKDALRGRQCYLGLDLSSTTDLTALVALFPPDGNDKAWHAVFEAWIPEEGMKERERRDGVPFSRWAREGLINVTEGNAVDYGAVEEKTLEYAQMYDVQLLGVDPWNSRMLTQRLMDQGIEVLEIPQTFAGMSPAMKDMERLLRRGDMTHEKHDVARWCFGNVRNTVDGNENIKPMKNKSTGRIDITVAWIIAVAAARSRMSMEVFIYKDRGIMFV